MKKLSADGGAELEGPEFVRDNDARVTRVGRFIRATRIDELPQALNVIQRQMNFIGPRPERPEFVERLQEEMPYFSMRHLVKPGITGWAQVNNPLHSSLKENLVKLEYDLYYIKNRSFLLDLIILLRTFAIIVRGIGK
jgi:lipopolysaccharide/colanic/teichoic acid biosynthesis glycosyltransferase